ncbi:STAS/SEC14 domain-containing protein [Sulfitobacter sp. D35]|uniref:STAS/SEC14 domain-containing protein n=1 Tax=Sulfitobacter sp. D35 TaxID=3083252 RepID=UPI00296EE3CC|nr:STAS/SEC14 domain-containing protein [Sulfitobacter sp. D35]MDW4498245.1 STAS/SEC14 domain-containing protein [Sulfitobacter sp. D35]
MLKVTKVAPNRVDLVLQGRLEGEDMRKGLDDLVEMSEGLRDGRMLYTVTDFEMPSAAALGVEFGRLPKLFSMISRFDRCAVLCDQSWIRSVAEIEGALIPGLRIKAFPLVQKEAAESWLAE